MRNPFRFRSFLVRVISTAVLGLYFNMMTFTAWADAITAGSGAGREVGQQGIQVFSASGSSTTLKDVFSGYQGADTPTLEGVFGSDAHTIDLGQKANTMLATETSTTGDAYRVLRGVSQRVQPDMSKDPMFNNADTVRSNDYMSSFQDTFSDCKKVDQFADTTIKSHIANYKTCERLVKPQGNCDISHEIKVKAGPVDLVFLVDNSGSMDGVIAELRRSVSNLATLLGSTNEGDLHLGGALTRGSDYVSKNIDLTADTAAFQGWINSVGTSHGDTYNVNAANYVLDTFSWRSDVQKVLVIIGNEDGPGGDTAALVQRMAAQGVTAYIFHNNKGVQSLGTYIANSFSATGLYKMAQFLVVVEDYWTPKDCLDAATATMEEFCTGSYSTTVGSDGSSASCVNLSGFDVCPGDPIYSKLQAPPIPNVDRLAQKVHVSALQCNYNVGQMACYTDAQGQQQCPQNDGSNLDSCASFEQNSSCGFVSQSCVQGASGSKGTCYVYNETWDCGYDVTVPTVVNTGQKIECPGEARCMGSECFDASNTKSGDFAYAVAMLQVTQFAEQDMTCASPDSLDCKIFGGQPMECKKALGGYVDCCEAPQGISIFDYVNLTMASLKMASSVEALSRTGSLFAPGYWQAGEAALESGAGALIKGEWGDIVSSATGQFDATLAGEVGLGQLEQQLMQWAYDQMVDMGAAGAADAVFATGEDGAVSGLTSEAAAVVNFIGFVYTVYVITDMLIHIIWKCEASEFELDAKKETRQCSFVGSYCASKALGQCIEKRDAYCCFGSVVGRIIQEQGRQQLGLNFGEAESPSCDGLTPAQLQQLDWSKIDLSEWIGMLSMTGNLPTVNSVSLSNLTGNGSQLNDIFNQGTGRADTVQRNVERLDGVDVDSVKRKAAEQMQPLQ